MKRERLTLGFVAALFFSAETFAASDDSVARIRRVTYINNEQEVDYPTRLAQVITKLAGTEDVRRDLAISGGDGIVTRLAHTYVRLEDGYADACLFSNTFVRFDSLNLWLMQKGSLYAVARRGRLELVVEGVVSIFAESELYVKIADGRALVYVLEGRVTLQVGTSTLALRGSEAAEVIRGARPSPARLSPGEQRQITNDVEGAKRVMSRIGGGGSGAIAIAAGGGAAAALALGLIERDPTTTSSTTSTSSSTTTTVVPRADVVVTKTDSPDPVNARATLTYDVRVSNRGPSVATGVKLVDTLPSTFIFRSTAGAGCSFLNSTVTCDLGTVAVGAQVRVSIVGVPSSPGTITNKATVSSNEFDPDLKSNEVSENTTVRLGLAEPPAIQSLQTAFTSFLGVGPFDGSARGRVMLNDSQVGDTDNSSPFVHQVSARAGENTVEASLPLGAATSGFWRFDFSGAAHFVAGSLRVEVGQVISLDAHSVVFGVGGRGMERLRFTYVLRP